MTATTNLCETGIPVSFIFMTMKVADLRSIGSGQRKRHCLTKLVKRCIDGQMGLEKEYGSKQPDPCRSAGLWEVRREPWARILQVG